MSDLSDLSSAKARLLEAFRELQAARRAALLGAYDADTLQRALSEYRAAEDDVRKARRAEAQSGAAVNRLRGEPRPAPVQVPECFVRAMAEPEPFVPSARMRFVKWLIATGRLSDEC